MAVRIYSKMSGVGIDRLDLKSVRSLMQPLVIAPVVNVSSLWDVCNCAWPHMPDQTGLDLCKLSVWENMKVQVKLTVIAC